MKFLLARNFENKCLTYSIDEGLHDGVVVQQHVDNRRPQVAIFFRQRTGSCCLHKSLATRARIILWCLRFLAFLARVRHRDDYNGASLACSVHNEIEEIRGLLKLPSHVVIAFIHLM